MSHQSNWHIIDSQFAQKDNGLLTPNRIIESDGFESEFFTHSGQANALISQPDFELKIINMDRNDPPGYQNNSVPRDNNFNGNIFRITSEPRMPPIEVNCKIKGFVLEDEIIFWRLQCRHVLCRHAPQGKYKYKGACEILEGEWQGRSKTATFTLFEENFNSANLLSDYNSIEPGGPVMGGHAILSVAAKPRGSTSMLVDYVHLRIGGTNPQRQDVEQYIMTQLGTRNTNIVQMLKAIFAKESGFNQFKNRPQKNATMNFVQKHHGNDQSQPNCKVQFDWPNDPANFPNVSFDFGVGISQYTKIVGRVIGREVTWDWRENVKIGINLFLEKLRDTYRSNLTWRTWALRAWEPYNGAGPQAVAYAQDLLNSPEGQKVSNDPLPANLNVQLETTPLAKISPNLILPPPTWPPNA